MDYGKIAFGFIEICLALLVVLIPFHSKKFRSFFIKQSEKKRIIEKGKFDCPNCKSEQSFKRVQVVGTSGAEVERYILCARCKSKLDSAKYSENAKDGRLELAFWECPKCKSSNPNSIFTCLQCKYSLS